MIWRFIITRAKPMLLQNADALSRKANCKCTSATPVHATLCQEMEKMNLAIRAEGTLTNITLTPTLRDQIIAAQKNDVGMGKIRQRLSENDPRVQCFHQDSEEVFGLKIDWWYLKIWSFESRFSMRLTSLGILSTLVVTKCTKI